MPFDPTDLSHRRRFLLGGWETELDLLIHTSKEVRTQSLRTRVPAETQAAIRQEVARLRIPLYGFAEIAVLRLSQEARRAEFSFPPGLERPQVTDPWLSTRVGRGGSLALDDLRDIAKRAPRGDRPLPRAAILLFAFRGLLAHTKAHCSAGHRSLRH